MCICPLTVLLVLPLFRFLAFQTHKVQYVVYTDEKRLQYTTPLIFFPSPYVIIPSMLNLNSVMVGTMRVKVLTGFYNKVFGKPPEMEEDGWAGWMVGSSFFSVGVHSQMKGKAKDPGRIMFDFETTEVKAEFARLVKLGAVPVKEPYQMEKMWIATLADPDGNYFQLMSPWSADNK